MSPNLHVLSDLHLETGPYRIPEDLDYDILVAAGDIGPVQVAVPWLAAIGKPVVYVLGNHEHWGTDFGAALEEARTLAAGTQVHVLEREAVVVSGIRFLGATLWTDFGRGHDRLIAGSLLRDFTQIEAKTWLARPDNLERLRQLVSALDQDPASRDDRLARLDRSTETRFSPYIAMVEHRTTMDWLWQAILEPTGWPTVVVTHHAPSYQSLELAGINPLYLDRHSDAFGCVDRHIATKIGGYASDRDDFLRKSRGHLEMWIHGHLHHGIDYLAARGGHVRILCNPRGYAQTPPSEKERKLYALLGTPISDETLARRQAAYEANPNRGDADGFDQRLVIDWADGIRAPLTRLAAPLLERLRRVRAETADLIEVATTLRGRPRRVIIRAIERCIADFRETCRQAESSVLAPQYHCYYFDSPLTLIGTREQHWMRRLVPSMDRCIRYIEQAPSLATENARDWFAEALKILRGCERRGIRGARIGMPPATLPREIPYRRSYELVLPPGTRDLSADLEGVFRQGIQVHLAGTDLDESQLLGREDLERYADLKALKVANG